MNVLITGAAGFLGSHLVLHHLAQGDKVLGIDNFSSSRRDYKYSQKLHSLCVTDNKFKIFDIDVSSKAILDFNLTGYFNSKFDYESKFKLDVIYNMACPASPLVYQRIPIETIMTCVSGMQNTLTLAERHNSRLVQASTSEVYGNPNQFPQHESYLGNVNCWGPRANYDEGKRCAEALCYEYINKRNVDVRVARIFNTYGPHLLPQDGRVISNFVLAVGNDKPLTLHGDGNRTRSFCYVSDLISGLTTLGSPNTPHGSKLHPMNLGNPNEFTLFELIEVLKTLYPKYDVEPIVVDDAVDDPQRRCPDIEYAQRTLNWEPKICLVQGLYYLANYWHQLGVIKNPPKPLSSFDLSGNVTVTPRRD